MPKVSIIIPTFNRADMIGDAIHSIQCQSFGDWEAIIIDDGSSDNTAQIVETYQDRRIRYFYQENTGLPGARNAGISNSVGSYIAFLDSDDLFLPEKLSWQVTALDSDESLGMVTGGYIEVDKELHILRELRPWEDHPSLELSDLLVSCPFCPSAPLIRREWLEKVSLFDESMRRIEDWDLWLRMSYEGCRMEWIKKPVCYYRIHGGNMVRSVILMKEGMVTMLDKLYSHQDLSPEILSMHGQAYGNVYLNAAARAFAVGAMDEGKESLSKALEYDPQLLAGKPPRFLSSLASFALGPLAEDPVAFMDRVIENLPRGDKTPAWTKRKGRGLLYAVSAFESAKTRQRRSVIDNTWKAILLDPAWLMNRGLLSIAGSALANRLKS